jgi:hypothetical protein
MKKIIILISTCFLTLSCLGQHMQDSMDFMDFIKYPDSPSRKDCFLNEEKNLSIAYIYYEFDMYETQKNGDGCFFAIPQEEYEIWKVENKTDWKREDFVKNNQEKTKMAKKLLSSKRNLLFEKFDLYVFYVKQGDIVMEGSYMTDDGKLRDDYHHKEDATIYTYKCQNGIWIEMGKANIEGSNTRYFGESVVENILKERFGKDILDQ